MNDFSTCTLAELWHIQRTYWSVMDDDNRANWQTAKDKKERQEFLRQRKIMKEQARSNYANIE